MDQGHYQVTLLDETCHAIDEGGVRCFLFVGTEKALLVDTGFGQGDLKALVSTLTDLPVMLVNTHTDGDHTGCNHQFEAVYMHPAEYDRYAGKGHVNLANLHPLWEGDRIDIGGRSFEVVLIPGHTPGSIALLDDQNRVLVGGDSIQGGNIYMFGPGRNIPAYRDSMAKLMGMTHRFDVVYASHSEVKVDAGMIALLYEDAQALMTDSLPGEVVEMHGNRVRLVNGHGHFLIPMKE